MTESTASPAVAFGKRLRRLRDQKGLNQNQLAEAVFASKSSVSDWERGEALPARKTVVKLEEVLDADGVLLELYELASLGQQTSATVADAEHGALSITEYDQRVVPALLQTEDYARAHLRVGRIDRLSEEVRLRMGRQALITSGDLLAGWFILDQAVLLRVVGGREVMRGQLAHLEAMAERSNIFLQVLPFGAGEQPGLNGPLRVITYRDRPSVWFTESPRSGRLSDDLAGVVKAVTDLDIIKAAALPVDQSVEFLRDVRETTYEQ
ncbi:MAG TPA: helix-turn-helix transcriptional regulator [Trebonia sp.]|nr:helix-turn-helix transcriptional regulator [Trebonia sp.]